MTAPQYFPFPYTLAPDDGPPEPDPGPPPVVLVYGDSFTHLGSWPLLVRDRLRLAVGNDADSGSGFVAVGWRTTIPYAVTVWQAPGAAVVVVFGGVNDVNLGHPPTAVRLAAVVTLAAARAAHPRAVLVLVGPQWPATTPTAAALTIRDQLRAAAGAAGAMFVDPTAWFAGRPDLIGPDGLHPNDGGQALIADRMAPIIAAALDEYATQEVAP